ncbi:MAG: hypothetical protein ACFFDK_14625 [Promethearchaeota archaeon]
MIELILIVLAYKLTKNNNKRARKSNRLSLLKEGRRERNNFYNISIKTRSNIINLQEPLQLPYETEEFYRKIRQKELKVVDFQSCQFCGSLSNVEAEYCFYCGNKLIKENIISK